MLIIVLLLFCVDKYEGGLDIGTLFDHALLREAAGKIKQVYDFSDL